MSFTLCQRTTELPLTSASGPPVASGVRFGIATDSHYAEKPTFELKHYSGSLEKMDLFIRRMNSEKVDFIIHLGDLKDEGLARRPPDTLKYLKDISSVMRSFNGPTYHCIGNHDLDSITKEEFLNGVSNTGIDPGKSYFSFACKGLHGIVLDPNFDTSGRDLCFKQGGDWQDTNIPEDQLHWLEQELSKNKGPVVVFCHQLLFELVIEPYRYHVNNYLQVREILERSGKVIAVFQGHSHTEIFKRINNIPYIALPAMLEYPGTSNSCFSLVEIDARNILVHGFHGAGFNRI